MNQADKAARSRAAASILVVEDEWLLASDLSAMLGDLGYNVTGPVSTGEQAVETAVRTRPDLVLMDIGLRGAMDGVAAAARIGEATGAPIVFLSGYSGADIVERAKSASPYSYLIKPVNRDELRCTIEVSLHRHIMEMELRQRELEVERLNALLEQRVAERTAELESSNQELDAFSYSVAHDLRTPLRSIDGFTQLVLEQSQGSLGEDAQRHLLIVRASVKRMSQLIDDLLSLAHVMRRGHARVPIDLSAAAAELDTELRAANPGRAVQFINQPDVMAAGDPTLLGVVLSNLLSNAWKFTATVDQPRVEFGAVRLAGELRYFVRDNGVGFEAKYAERMFGVFQRLHSARDFSGNGIGLALVQRAVKRHGGRVWAEGEPNVGSTFWFSIPDQLNVPEQPLPNAELSSKAL